MPSSWRAAVTSSGASTGRRGLSRSPGRGSRSGAAPCRTFGTVIDSGLFHVLGDFECPPYVRSFSRVLRPGGRCFMLAFSDLEPGEFSLPRRVASGEVRESFSIGWRIDPIRPAVFESRIRPEGSLAWLSALTRV